METNFLIIAITALVPLVFGFIWYHPKLFGNAWMTAAGIDPESGKKMNMLKVFSLTYLMSFIITFELQFIVIHQYGVLSIFSDIPDAADPTTAIGQYFSDFMTNYGHKFRTLKHGLLHGVLGGLFLITPIFTVNALFEQKGFKYIALNSGYWTICLGIMGGILCQFA